MGGEEAATGEEVEMEKVTMKIIDESERLKGEMVGVSVEEEEGVRKRKGVINNLAEQETSRLLIGEDELKTSQFEAAGQGGWVEKDPETTQSFKRRQQPPGLFSLAWAGGDSDDPEVISREEAWKLYIKKLQDESNYLLPTPDAQEICVCQDCLSEYELQCNEVLGWRRRAPTVEGFTKEVNALCDPSTGAIIQKIVQDKYRSLPCTIM